MHRDGGGPSGGRWRPAPCFALACLLFAVPGEGFLPNFWSRVLTLSWNSQTHQYITEQAILNVTMETLESVGTRGLNRSEEETRLGRGFWRAVGEVVKSNAAMDFLSSTRSDPVYHFDSEQVDGAMVMLRQFWAQTLLSVRAREYQSARHSLGRLFHSLQDFYSHSNWVEMGQRFIYLHLLHPEEPAVPVAKNDTPTCMECFTITCRENLLPRLRGRQQQAPLLLTTGYFSTFPPKPQGKCSHGGILDSSRHLGSEGGINKDSTSPLFSPHHYLHADAAGLAMEATLTVLRDLRDTVGHKSFLRLFSVNQAPALVFVMDTTGSMFEEITAARRRAHAIIQSRSHGGRQMGTFLLVPFHDPGVGPVYETDDPDKFMEHMENLMALGGGDEPEMCFSAIQLALTHSPPLSEIFVFTDASPKDVQLFEAVKALTLEKQSKVTFLLTDDPSHAVEVRGRRKRSMRGKRHRELPHGRFSLYSSLSSVSGGLTIFTTNSDIHRVSAIVEDNTAVDKVTLLHVKNDHNVTSSHSFRVDSTVQTVLLHITGTLIDCKLTNPLGLSQSLLKERGPLADWEHFEGLYRISLLSPIQPGLWNLNTQSLGALTFNVIGDSRVDFLYYFATVTNDTHPGLARVEGSPVAGVPVFLVLSITGLGPSEEAFFSHVTLLGPNGKHLKRVWLNSTSSALSLSNHPGQELVGWVDAVPRVPFCIRLSGRDSRGNKIERVSTEMIQPTYVQIQILSSPRLVPGHSTIVHFDIMNHGPARLFNLTADDDRGYLHRRGPHSFPIAEHGSLRGQVDVHTPATAQAGGTVTLTLTLRALDSPDTNYAVVYLTVFPPDPDTSPPSCTIARVQWSCPQECNMSTWSLFVVVSDRGRSGLAAVQLQKGEGVLTLFHTPPPSTENPAEEGAISDVHEEVEDIAIGNGHHRHYHGHRHNLRARLRKGEAAVNVSQWTLASSQPLWVRYTSGCCFPQAEMLVWDGDGNMKRCPLSPGHLGQKRERVTESRGPQMVLPTIVNLIWFCLWCCLESVTI